MQIFSNISSAIRKALKAKPGISTHNNNASGHGTGGDDGSQPMTRKVFLNSVSEMGNAREIVVLGDSSGSQPHEPVVQRLRNGTEMSINPDGSFVVRDQDGLIVKTCDVMKVKREFSRDPNTGELMVLRFGMWTKPTAARLDDSGNFFWNNHDVEVEERLNGLHVQINRHTGVMIQTHQKNQLEIVKMANGEVWRRETTREKETFTMWQHGKLTFKSQTMFVPERNTINTPNGSQSLANVSRLEQSWHDGMLTREKCTFRNPSGADKTVNVTIQLNGGILMLKQVESTVSAFIDGRPSETTYHLQQPINLKVDIPGTKATLNAIVRVRNFDGKSNVGLAFEDKTGTEYIIFTGQLDGRGRKTARELGGNHAEDYESLAQYADLVLR